MKFVKEPKVDERLSEKRVDFSGKWLQRVPKSLHAKAIEAAEKDGVSLNQWVSMAIAQGLGESCPDCGYRSHERGANALPNPLAGATGEEIPKLSGPIVNVLANPLLMRSKRLKELAAQFRWKAENNIRFYEKLEMTTEQKVDFLAQEFASVYWLGEIRRLDWPAPPNGGTE